MSLLAYRLPILLHCTPDAEGEAGQRHHAEAAKFMKNVQKEIYGTSGDGGTLQERVTRQKYYIDRKPDDSNAFRRGG